MKITLMVLGESGQNKKITGHSIGCQYSWYFQETDIISMMDKESWFVKKFKLKGKNVYDELNAQGKPVIVQKKWKNLKVPQIVYPLKEIIKEFGIKYFTCTQAYMIAYTLYQGYDEIELVGFDSLLPEADEDDTQEWANIVWDEIMCQNFWVGFAKGRGVEIYGSSGLGVPITPKNEWKYAYNVSSIHKEKRKEILKELQEEHDQDNS